MIIMMIMIIVAIRIARSVVMLSTTACNITGIVPDMSFSAQRRRICSHEGRPSYGRQEGTFSCSTGSQDPTNMSILDESRKWMEDIIVIIIIFFLSLLLFAMIGLFGAQMNPQDSATATITIINRSSMNSMMTLMSMIAVLLPMPKTFDLCGRREAATGGVGSSSSCSTTAL